MEDYGLGLALFDYLPVLLSVVGLYMLANFLATALPDARALLLFGFALVAVGGLCKATWKLIWVLAEVDLVVLDSLLFICMAPGMVLLAMHTAVAGALWRGGARALNPSQASLFIIVPVMAAAIVLAVVRPEGRAWLFLLLYASALANVAMSVLLIRLSWGWQQRLTASIFLLSMLLTLSLSWLARFAAGSLPLQWLAESINLLATGSFAVAVWRLRSFGVGRRKARTDTGRSAGLADASFTNQTA